MPEYGVISVGKNNSYGHPDDDVLSRLRDADVQVYRTDQQSDVIATSDGQTVRITTEKNVGTQAPSTPIVQASAAHDTETVGAYIGNQNSHVFHLPTCKNLPAQKNQVLLDNREDAVNAGFRPCGNCKP